MVNTANYLELTHTAAFTGSRAGNEVPCVLGSSDCSRGPIAPIPPRLPLPGALLTSAQPVYPLFSQTRIAS